MHFEPGFGGRPWVFGGEVEHSSPASAAAKALAVAGGLRPRLEEIRQKLKPSLQSSSASMDMREELNLQMGKIGRAHV